MEHPQIRDYILRSISGSGESLWPLDWFERFLGERRFPRALSIGCGTGALERDIVRRNLAESVDAFDGSTNSLRLAKEQAAGEGVSQRIHYFAADFNRPVLTRSKYDAVFIHQALHHVEKLEKLLRSVHHILKPDGVLYLDEYVGPSRNEWVHEMVEWHRQRYESYPPAARKIEPMPLPIEVNDPSEAIRSSEILEQVRVGFEVVAMRPYGGNVLGLLLPYLQVEELAQDEIDRLIVEEQKILARGEPSYYAIIVARPRRGFGGTLASARYFAEPKLKRIGRELRALFA